MPVQPMHGREVAQPERALHLVENAAFDEGPRRRHWQEVRLVDHDQVFVHIKNLDFRTGRLAGHFAVVADPQSRLAERLGRERKTPPRPPPCRDGGARPTPRPKSPGIAAATTPPGKRRVPPTPVPSSTKDVAPPNSTELTQLSRSSRRYPASSIHRSIFASSNTSGRLPEPRTWLWNSRTSKLSPSASSARSRSSRILSCPIL